ncbi:hypothetical protein [Rhodococcus erythropolis]|uniref:hypothetical protein n=1 Tax=Rhodococcus erythropolis TaxID=1833 RepID=UPI00211E7767|nr:hypothetical protein [Rhodococcus erythropolis]
MQVFVCQVSAAEVAAVQIGAGEEVLIPAAVGSAGGAGAEGGEGGGGDRGQGSSGEGAA